MSVIAKILIVLNLVLAVVFLGASATYLGQQESWKKQATQLEQEKEDLRVDLTGQLEKAREDATAQERVAQQKDAEVRELQAQLQARDADYQQIEERFSALSGQYERLSQTYRDAISQNATLTQEKNAALQAKEAAETAKRNAIATQNTAETEADRLEGVIETLQNTVAALEKQVNSQAEELDSREVVIAAYRKQVGDLPGVINPEMIEAKVTGVDNDLNIVMLSVGRDDKVQVGYEFTIFRGNEYVGKVRIDKVEKDYASGYSVKELEKTPIQVGDNATTRF